VPSVYAANITMDASKTA